MQDLVANNLNVFELFALAGLYHKDFEEYVDNDLFENLVKKEFIEITKFQTKLSNKGIFLMRKLTTRNSKVKNANIGKNLLPKEEQVSDEFVKQFRSLFKGTKLGAMGSEKAVKSKLTRFIKENPKATEDIIIEATRRYIDSLDSYRYIQQADYFIFKRDVYSHNEESSKLSAYVDEVIANPGETNDDWTVNII